MNRFHNNVSSFSRSLTVYFDQRLSRFNLATSYIELMILLHKEEAASQKEVAEMLSLAPSTITRFVNKLKKEGYIIKKRDGRNMTLQLTEAGQRVSADMEAEYMSAVNLLQDVMGEKYLETVGKLMEYGSGELENLSETNT